MCLLLMDESGDPGMKLGEGYSDYFTVCLVLFPDEADAELCRARIHSLRAELGMKLSGKASEFHFCKLSHERREAFLTEVSAFPFSFFTATITKARLSGRAWLKKDYMYETAATMAIDLVRDELLEAKLVFDATSSRTFDWGLLRKLKKHVGTYEGLPVIKETRRFDSHKDDLIQLVDMVCGAAMCEEDDYRRIIRHKKWGRAAFPEEGAKEPAPVT
jgi:Protein of unknown function (DUF3800)